LSSLLCCMGLEGSLQCSLHSIAVCILSQVNGEWKDTFTSESMCLFLVSVNWRLKYLKLSFCLLLFGGGNLISLSSGKCRLMVFEMEVLRGILDLRGWKQHEVGENYNEELYMLHSAQCIVTMFKSVRMCWVQYVSCVGMMAPYFGIVAGLVWSYDRDSYAGGSICYW